MDGNQQRVFDYQPVKPARSAPGSEARKPLSEAQPALDQKEWQTTDPAYLAETSILRPPKRENWLVRRGHLISYLGLLLFTIAVYLRPYELISALSPLSTMAFWLALFTLLVFFPTQLNIEGNLTARPREINLLLLLGLLALLSIPLASDPMNSLDSFGDFIKIILMFIVMVNVLRTWRRWHGLFLLLLGTACYLSVSAVSDYLTGRANVEGFRASGIGTNMFQNPNDMALFLVTLIPVLVAMALGTRSLLMKALYAGCVGLMLGAVLVSFSRGGFLGLVVAGAVMIWKIARRQRLAAFALALILTLPLLVFAPGGFGRRLISSIRDTGAGSSVSARRSELKKSIIVTLRYPLFGVGLGNYRFRSDRGHSTHNSYTQVSSELGIAAMIIYIMFIVAPFRRLRRIEQEASASRPEARFRFLAIGLQAGLVGYMVSSFFASVAFLWHIYYLVGLSICLSRLYGLQFSHEPDEVGRPASYGGAVERGDHRLRITTPRVEV